MSSQQNLFSVLDSRYRWFSSGHIFMNGLLYHSKQTLRGTVGKMNLYHQEDAFLQHKVQVID